MIEYYHLRVKGGVRMLLSADGEWCESWDGHMWGVNPLKKGTCVMRAEDGSCERVMLSRIEYKVEV